MLNALASNLGICSRYAYVYMCLLNLQVHKVYTYVWVYRYIYIYMRWEVCGVHSISNINLTGSRSWDVLFHYCLFRQCLCFFFICFYLFSLYFIKLTQIHARTPIYIYICEYTSTAWTCVHVCISSMSVINAPSSSSSSRITKTNNNTQNNNNNKTHFACGTSGSGKYARIITARKHWVGDFE